MQGLPNNNMCASHHQCTNECCRVQPETPLSVEVVPALSESVTNTHAELAVMHEQIGTLETAAARIQEQMTSLDKSVEAQRLDRKEILALMQDLSTALADVRQELGEHRSTVSTVAARINEQRSQNEQQLSDFERQLKELLSQLSSSTP